MTRRLLAVLLIGLLAPALPAQAQALVSPVLHIESGGGAGPQVALTLDLCSGSIDMRILSALVAERIPATIFVTARWLRHNGTAMQLLLAHPDLFELEDHGAEHVPAVLGAAPVYGIAPAGTLKAVTREVEGGAVALIAAGVTPVWFRGATALYSPEALTEIGRLGYRVAGFSLNGDDGATKSAHAARVTIAAARDGDVIIAHLNQPHRHAGTGVVAGLRDLKARGFRFVRLADVVEIEN